MFFTIPLTGQEKSTVVVVSDSLTRQLLENVNVQVGQNEYFITDTSGRIRVWHQAENTKIKLSHVSFQEKIITIPSSADSLIIEMLPKNFILEQVSIAGRYKRNNLLTNSFHSFKAKEINKIPGFLGEKDLIKSLQYLPGVYNPSEANTGLFVRGGTSDQTRIYLNGAPLFNPSHLYNFLSTFNPDIIQSIDFYKGGIPAEYGNAGSSVLDIRLRQPNEKSLHVGGAVGLLTSRITFDGTLGKKLGYLVSARRTYADFFLQMIKPENLAIEDDGFHFYDLNAVLFYNLSTNWRITMQGYKGSDYFNTVDIDDQLYGNTMAGVSMTGNVSDRSILNLNGFYTQYNFFDLGNEEKGILTNKQAGLHLNMATEMQNVGVLNYGAQAEWTFISPYQKEKLSTGTILYTDSFKMKASFLNALYASFYGSRNQFSWEIGLRLNHYQQIGPGMGYEYLQLNEQTYRTITDTNTYSPLKPVQRYTNLEPRASLEWQPYSDLKAYISYDQIHQYQYYFSRSNFIGPWTETILADKYLKPVEVKQLATGLSFTNKVELKAEIYLKQYENILSYNDETDYLAGRPYEQFTSQGSGWAKGFDLLLKRDDGNISGWASYSLGEVTYAIDGINSGKPFHPPHDIRHKFNFIAGYRFNDIYEISMGWTYHSGAPVELPDALIEYEGLPVIYYDHQNRYKYRKKAYHRADIQFSITPEKNRERNWKSKWEFSVYNFYGRRNPLYYDYLDTYAIAYSPALQRGLPKYSYDPKIFYLFYITPSVTYYFSF